MASSSSSSCVGELDLGPLVAPKQFGDKAFEERGASLIPWYEFAKSPTEGRGTKGAKRSAEEPPSKCEGGGKRSAKAEGKLPACKPKRTVLDDDHSNDESMEATTAKPLAKAKAMTPAQAATRRADKEDVAAVLRTLEGLRAHVLQREKENNEAYHAGKYPEWRLIPRTPEEEAQVAENVRISREAGVADADRNTARDPKRQMAYGKFLALNKLLSCDNDAVLQEQGAVLVSYEDFTRASIERVDITLLGHTDGYNRDYQKLSHSNRESSTLDYATRHAERLVSSVPAWNGDHRLTPMQRLATALITTTYDEGQHIMVKDYNTSYSSKVAACYRMHAGDQTEVIINNLPVAAGKTRGTIFATMSHVASKEAWAATRARFKRFREEGTKVQYLGLNAVPFIEEQPVNLARVVIALVPPPVMQQWADASERLAESFGKNRWVTWCGPVPAGQSKRHGHQRTLPDAIKEAKEKKCAIFWVLEACTHSSSQALLTAPNFGVPYRIIDEGTGSHLTEPRTKKPQSPCHFTVICNATLEQLEEHTQQQPKHPLRRAMGGVNMQLTNMRHCAIATMCSLPSWMRLGVGLSMAPLMPRGILKICLRVQVQTLSGSVKKGSDMLITSTDDLIKGLILDNCSDMSTTEKSDLSDKCHAILDRTEAGISIADNLMKAVDTVDKDEKALPPLPQPYEEGGSLTPEQRVIHADICRTRRVFGTMRRLFHNLKQAVSLDPPPECPITLDVIAPENMCILSCCTTFIDRQSVAQLVNQRCPMCRQPITGLASVQEAVSTLAPKEPKEPAKPAAPPPPPVPVGDTDGLVAAFKRVAGTKCNSSLDAVVQSLELALQYKPKGLRVLLCCNVNGNSRTYNATLDEAKNTSKSREFLQTALPALTSVSTIGNQRSQQQGAYKKNDNTNRMLIIDTSSRSTTMAGLDFQMTDLILFDRLGYGGDIELAKIIQSIGRAMRAQKKGAAAAKEDDAYYVAHGHSRHAPKMVVFLDKFRPT